MKRPTPTTPAEKLSISVDDSFSTCLSRLSKIEASDAQSLSNAAAILKKALEDNFKQLKDSVESQVLDSRLIIKTSTEIKKIMDAVSETSLNAEFSELTAEIKNYFKDEVRKSFLSENSNYPSNVFNLIELAAFLSNAEKKEAEAIWRELNQSIGATDLYKSITKLQKNLTAYLETALEENRKTISSELLKKVCELKKRLFEGRNVDDIKAEFAEAIKGAESKSSDTPERSSSPILSFFGSKLKTKQSKISEILQAASSGLTKAASSDLTKAPSVTDGNWLSVESPTGVTPSTADNTPHSPTPSREPGK